MYKRQIPARGGSKRIPNKNLASLCGRPLIYYTLQAAKESKIFDKIIVSTDSQDIAHFSNSCGVLVNELRPLHLSCDNSTAANVIQHHIENIPTGNICYLQPTSPLRSIEDILASYRKFKKGNYNSVIGVTSCEIPNEWTYQKEDNFDSFLATLNVKRSQDYTERFRINGAIYWFKVEAFKSATTHLIPYKSHPFFMPLERSIDIDTELDLLIAETLMKENLLQSSMR